MIESGRDDIPDEKRDRRAELIAAAVCDDLTEAEKSELDALRAADRFVDRDIDELRATRVELAASVNSWNDTSPSPDLRARVTALGREPESNTVAAVDGDELRADNRTTTHRQARSLGSKWVLGAAAAACIVVGAGGVLGTQAITSQTATGEPGTLGALEHVDFGGEPIGVSVDGALVAHTWGTETVLEIDGLARGDSYTVVLVERNGTELPSGTFLGSEATITCRMNAAVMRSDVTSVEIQDDAGRTISIADLPVVERL